MRTPDLAGRLHNPLRTFDVSHDDHDEEAVVVGVVSVVNAGSDLARADHLLQGDQHQLDRQEGHTLVEEVEGAVKDQVPVTDGQNIRISRLSLLFLYYFCQRETIINDTEIHVDPTDGHDVYLSSVYLNVVCLKSSIRFVMIYQC